MSNLGHESVIVRQNTMLIFKRCKNYHLLIIMSKLRNRKTSIPILGPKTSIIQEKKGKSLSRSFLQNRQNELLFSIQMKVKTVNFQKYRFKHLSQESNRQKSIVVTNRPEISMNRYQRDFNHNIILNLDKVHNIHSQV